MLKAIEACLSPKKKEGRYQKRKKPKGWPGKIGKNWDVRKR